MIPIDIIHTLTCNLPEAYAPLIVHFNTLLEDASKASNPTTVQYVIKQLLNEENCQSKVTGAPIFAKIAQSCKSNGICFNCGDPSRLKTDCDVSPCEVHCCQECKLWKLKLQDGDGEANMGMNPNIDDGHILYPPYAIY